MDSIATNLARVHADVAEAAIQAGRRPEHVRLIAVSKTHPASAVTAAAQTGQRDFGESAVQEAVAKFAEVTTPTLEWHFIGHLQSNKAKLVAQHFTWMHSLDSARLAQRLARLALEHGRSLEALIEINITRDPAKHGIAPQALFPMLDELLRTDLSGLRVRGLMTIGPHPASSSEMQTAFAELRQLRDAAAQRFALPQFTELSMGMSGDYREAIHEGSTMVRIGTAIFGHRDYSR